MDKKTKPKRLFTITFLLTLLMMGVCGNTWAQEAKPKITIHIDVMKEVRTLKGGKWIVEHVQAQKTQPEDTLLYFLTYRNEGDTLAKDVSIVDPIPEGTEYILDSAAGEEAEILYSINGGLSYQRPPIVYSIKKEDGSEEIKKASPDMYTHIKWLIKEPIPPKSSGRLRFKVKVQ